jgi:hypothetical protein
MLLMTFAVSVRFWTGGEGVALDEPASSADKAMLRLLSSVWLSPSFVVFCWASNVGSNDLGGLVFEKEVESLNRWAKELPVLDDRFDIVRLIEPSLCLTSRLRKISWILRLTLTFLGVTFLILSFPLFTLVKFSRVGDGVDGKADLGERLSPLLGVTFRVVDRLVGVLKLPADFDLGISEKQSLTSSGVICEVLGRLADVGDTLRPVWLAFVVFGMLNWPLEDVQGIDKRFLFPGKLKSFWVSDL